MLTFSEIHTRLKCTNLPLDVRWASWMAPQLKTPPAMQETRGTQVPSLGREDPLEATHSSILAWRIPWTEESGGLQSMKSQRVRRD